MEKVLTIINTFVSLRQTVYTIPGKVCQSISTVIEKSKCASKLENMMLKTCIKEKITCVTISKQVDGETLGK